MSKSWSTTIKKDDKKKYNLKNQYSVCVDWDSEPYQNSENEK